MSLQRSLRLSILFVACAVACAVPLSAQTPPQEEQDGSASPPRRLLTIPPNVPIRDLQPIEPGASSVAPLSPAAVRPQTPALPTPAQLNPVTPAPPAALRVPFQDPPAATALPSTLARREPEVPSDGFFPTPRMIERFLHHAAKEIGGQFRADSEQVEYFREVLGNRVPQWLQSNRGEIKRLTNEYIEAMLDESAPASDAVAAWSERALPVLDGAQKLIDDCVEDIRPALNEDQTLELEAELAAMRVAGSFVRSKLELWQAGGYDPDVDWPQGQMHDEVDRAESIALAGAQQAAREEITGVPAQVELATNAADSSPFAPRYHAEATLSLIDDSGNAVSRETNIPEPQVADAMIASEPQPPAFAAIKDPWDQYVDEFVTRYDLTADQTDTAYRYLHEAKRLRDRYQQKRLAEFRRIEAALRAPGEKDLTALKADFERLQTPIEGFHDQLRKRLDKLPTRAQRRAALERDQQDQPPSAVAEARG